MRREFAFVVPNEQTGEDEVQAITNFDSPTDAEMAAKRIHGQTAYSKETSQWAVRIPAIVKEGMFYNLKTQEQRNEKGELEVVRLGETPADYVPSFEDEMAELKKQNQELKQALEVLIADRLGM
jgi:hypothetical protein